MYVSFGKVFDKIYGMGSSIGSQRNLDTSGTHIRYRFKLYGHENHFRELK